MTANSENIRLQQLEWLVRHFLHEHRDELCKDSEKIVEVCQGLSDSLGIILDSTKEKAELSRQIGLYHDILCRLWQKITQWIADHKNYTPDILERRAWEAQMKAIIERMGGTMTILEIHPTEAIISKLRKRQEIPCELRLAGVDIVCYVADKPVFCELKSAKELRTKMPSPCRDPKVFLSEITLASGQPTVGLAVKSGRICFELNDFEMVRRFLAMIEGIEIDRICQCAMSDCNRWFIRRDGRQKGKKYCSTERHQKELVRQRLAEIYSDPERRRKYRKSQSDAYYKNKEKKRHPKTD